jgi:hypothetical protein
MKKAFALLLALALIGGAVFAEDVAYTLSGSATLTWGYDLDTEAHGFTNEADATIIIPFVAEQSSTHGEEPITGMIMLEDFAYVVSNDADEAIGVTGGDVTAKILFPSGLYMQIASAPDFEIDNANLQAPLTDDDWDFTDATITGLAAYNVAPSIASVGGFTLGMEGDLSFGIKVGSTNTHTAGTSGHDSYMAGLDVGYAVGDLATVGANFIYGEFGADPVMMGFGVTVDATPVEGLAVYLGADVEMDDITGMDLQFDASYEIADLLSFGAGTYVAIGDFAATTGNPWMGANVRLGVLAVENLTLDLGVDLWDILDAADGATPVDMDVLLGADAAYSIALEGDNYVKHYAGFNYSVVPEITVLDLGVEFVLFPMTTFDINFSAGSLTANTVAGGTSFGSDAAQDSGVFTMSVTIEY